MPCAGINRYGAQCGMRFGLNDDGYCAAHENQSPHRTATCNGTNRLGERCGKRSGLNADGYCGVHEHQCPSKFTHCKGSAYEQCGSTFNLNQEGYCFAHARKCLGYRIEDNIKCGRPAKLGYDFCCSAHDPELPYISPSRFSVWNLRESKLDQVYHACDTNDLYHGGWLPTDLSQYHMDHKFELQCWSFVFAQIDFDSEDEEDMCVEFVRDHIANHTENLCLTKHTTNEMKGQAVYKFLDDYQTGHRRRGDGRSFDMYLAEEEIARSFESLGDRVVQERFELNYSIRRAIRREMGRAVVFSIDTLDTNSDSPIFERLADELQRMYTDMDLNVPSRH